MVLMVNSNDLESICIPINEDLIIRLNELKSLNRMTWNSLFFHMVRVNKRPERLIRKYKRIYEDLTKNKVNFEIKISSAAALEFATWAAPFSSHGDALDYLVNAEKTRNKFHTLDDQKVFY